MKLLGKNISMIILTFVKYKKNWGADGSTVVKVLRYKSEGRWFDPQMVSLKFFIDINPSDRTMALGSTQPLTEMSTRSISWG
jgi:hypothetical protein